MTEPKPQPTAIEYLAAIERHTRNAEQYLKSIKNSMTFFVIVVILVFVVQACTAILTL